MDIIKLGLSKLHTNILQGALAGALATLTSALVSVILTALVVRQLPKELAGIYFLYLNFFAFIMLADAGLSPTLSREVAFSIGKFDHNNAILKNKILMGTAFRLLVMGGGLIFIISSVLGLVYFYTITSPENLNQVWVSWLIFALGGAIQLIAASGFAGLYGLGHVSNERFGRITVSVSGLILSLLMLQLGMGLIGLALAWLIQGFLALTLGWIILNTKGINFFDILHIFDKKTAIYLIKTGSQWALMSLGSFFIFNTANFMIGFYMNPKEVSEFSLIVRMAQLCQSISLALSLSAMPHISREFIQGNSLEIRQILKRTLLLGMLLAFSLISVIAIFAPKMLVIWVGEGHFAGYEVLIPYLIMTLLETHHVIHASAVVATGDIPFIPWSIGSGILTFIFCFYSLPILGLMGASLSIMVAQLLTNNWYAPFVSYKKFFV